MAASAEGSKELTVSPVGGLAATAFGSEEGQSHGQLYAYKSDWEARREDLEETSR